MDILAGLNEQQVLAVRHDSGPLLILAGAGSGKTKTLTHRIAYLIRERQTMPSQILAVTFTNKAAREMRERLAGLLGESADNRFFMPWMGTFHSICVRLLRMDGLAIGIDARFVIYDEDDRLGLIKQAMKSAQITDKDIKPRAIAATISKAKNDLLTAEDFSDSATGLNQQKIAEVFLAYEKLLRKAGALDFDDLLIKTVELLSTNQAIRKKWQDQFLYILIDEYQDTNAVQYALIRLLINHDRNICVVGDDAQSIYSFRGADYTNILNFERDFPGTTVVKLEQNYRSTSAILNLANSLIEHNTKKTDKKLWTNLVGGREPVFWQFYNEAEEGMGVAQEAWQQANAGREYNDMAVLYRTNAQSYAIERSLRERHIPYKIIGGLRFLDRSVVKDLLAYLRLLYQPNDRISFQRVVNLPKRGIGAVTVQKFLSWNDGNDRTIIENLVNVGESNDLTPKAKSALKSFGDILADLSSKLDYAPADLIEEIIGKINYIDFVNDGSPQSEEKIENIGVLITEAKAYVDIATFLEEMALMSSNDEQVDDQITLMTLHAAKGLEFPVVFLVGMEEGILPHARVFDSGKIDDIEEERRLCYVGVTRAREELFVSCATTRTQFGQTGYNMPSRFLEEMGLYSTESSQSAVSEVEYDNFYSDEVALVPGDRVRTPLFGPGEVLEVDGLAVSVAFDSGKTKKLNVEFARLEKL